ncbi:MAG: hypothetical protein D6691_01815 [Candidatus Hydrogenedentota bacterium]|jgi:hypothetical protein|nr:MAG: hypothetical protein D6691_01815 [Candidatus Hydrogenedentota bacterium]GIX44447.1 MAG: hypothetical protein KatS3mg130_0855 [Candidatus Sumerlaea sp.]
MRYFSVLLILAAASVGSADTVVISSGLNTAGSDFVTTQTPDNVVTFGYNWGSDPTPAGTGYTTVPASPGGDTVGLKIESNNTDDPTDYQEGVTVWCTTEPATNNYDVSVDAFIAYPITAPASGTTEHIGIVIQGSGTGLRGLRNNALSAINPAFGWSDVSTTASTYPYQDGIAFGFNGENGEAATDIFCYDPAARTGGPTITLNGQTGTFLGGDPSPTVAHDFNTFSYVLSQPSGRTLGNVAGWLWNTIKASVRETATPGQLLVTFYINGNPIVQLTSTKTTKKVGLIAGDPFASFSTPANESYMLFDNFRIIDVVPSTAAHDWQLFQ